MAARRGLSAANFRAAGASTVTLAPDQFKKAQWGLVGASWEHTLYFEAARARTGQTFSTLKSAHITNLVDLKWGARRVPMVKILLALAPVHLPGSVRHPFPILGEDDPIESPRDF